MAMLNQQNHATEMHTFELAEEPKVANKEPLSVGNHADGYDSDGSLPSARQSLARGCRHQGWEATEETSLLNSHQNSNKLEQSLDVVDDDDDDIVELTRSNRVRHVFKNYTRKYGTRIKIIILFAIMLASVVRHLIAV